MWQAYNNKIVPRPLKVLCPIITKDPWFAQYLDDNKQILAKINSYESIRLTHSSRMFFRFPFLLPIPFKEPFHRSRIINSIVGNFISNPLYSSKISFIIAKWFIPVYYPFEYILHYYTNPNNLLENVKHSILQNACQYFVQHQYILCKAVDMIIYLQCPRAEHTFL